MKKSIIVALFILLFPSASLAREKMLYDIADDTITRAEATINCTDPENSCTEADGIALKADSENSLRDIVELIRSGDLTRMKLSPEQILYLSSRLESLNSQLVHIGMFETACNLGFTLLSYAFNLLLNLLVGWAFEGPLLWILLVLPDLYLSIVFSLIGSLLLLTCIFGWI